MDRIVPISEARASLGNLVNETTDHPVYLLRDGKPIAVLLDTDKYERLLDYIEDLEDTIAVDEARAANDYVPFEPSTDLAAF